MSIKEQKERNDKKERMSRIIIKLFHKVNGRRLVKIYKEKKKNLPFYVINLIKRDEIYHGFKLIKSMSLMGQMENKLCQNFLMEEVN